MASSHLRQDTWVAAGKGSQRPKDPDLLAVEQTQAMRDGSLYDTGP